ncbi:MAG: carboxypeptidase-like regulatory domain-containing protein, partial [Prevotellaceae bacterium]|nr:carboxypeptidase-like regulatory domain-containing protein [Prevotellaceae bacterium]
MKRTFLILSLLSVCFCAKAQITISGIIRDEASSKPVADANVILQNKTTTAIYAYTITDENGKYSVACNVKTDSLQILITGLNVRETRIFVAAKTQTKDINVTTESLQIKEVKVKADPIVRRSDTIDYFVNSFADQSDRTIGDVLKKMPGIDVAPNGRISYNGKPINKFYIENLDMLEGRYGIATNNIQAKDIARVQVYENHQPTKVLQGVQHSDAAAINLTLKEDAKGTFNAVFQLGGGYKPAMWNGEFVAMYFARKFQTMSTYKTNNSGDDVSREFLSHTDDSQEYYTASQISIQKPTTPNVSQNRYLQNNIHTVSFNSLNRISQDIDIKANAIYVHDKQKSFGNSITAYHLPVKMQDIYEDIIARTTTDKAEASAEYLANTKTAFIKNKLQVNAMWNNNFGTVQTNADNVMQNFKNPQMSVSDVFALINVYNGFQLHIGSQNSFTKSSVQLNVTPLLYPYIFDNNSNFTGTMQDMNSSNFKSKTSIFTSKQMRNFDFAISAGYDLNIEKMTSSLVPFDIAQINYASADSLHNNIQWNQFKLFVAPNIRYNLSNLFNVNFGMPVVYLYQYSNDKIIDIKNKRNKFIVEPSLQISHKISVNTSISAGASISNYNGNLYDIYSGYIMNNYRTIANNMAFFNDAVSQNYNISLSYGDAIRSLFGSLSAIYYNNKNKLMQNINYAGVLTQISSRKIDNTYDGYILSGKISKRYDNIASTFGLFSTYRKSFNDLLRQDILLKYISDYINIGLSANV